MLPMARWVKESLKSIHRSSVNVTRGVFHCTSPSFFLLFSKFFPDSDFWAEFCYDYGLGKKIFKPGGMEVVRRDIYRWEREDPDSPIAGPGAFSPEDLGIEKKWLQLARIDPEQFSHFFDKYHDRILSYVFWRTDDLDVAADITDTVFAMAWQKLNQFRWQGYSFGAWLFRLARGETANVLRKRNRRLEVEFQPGRDDELDENSPDRVLETATDERLLRQCLQRLDDMRHEVFVLHYWVGLSTGQVAVVLKMPEGTVCSNLDRGRRQLLKCLQEHGLERGLSPQGQQMVQESLRSQSGLRVVNGEAENRDAED